MSTYPDAPGHRNIDTSVAAAEAIAPQLGRLQRMVETVIREAGAPGHTGDEVAVKLNVERWAVRPRTSELRRKGVIRASGKRRANFSGRLAIVWVAI